MRKIIPYVLLTLIFLSCRKEDGVPDEDISIKSLVIRPSQPITLSPIVEIEPYSSNIYNNCTSEIIHLTGVKRTITTEYQTLKQYYLHYEIYLDSVTGIGQNTGLVYQGGGKIDAIDTVGRGVSRAVHSRQLYDIKYYTNDSTHAIILNEEAEYQADVKGNIIIDHNNINDTCK